MFKGEMIKMKRFTENILKKHWETGELLTHKGKKYRVGRMSYGDYFFEPSWKRQRRETELHDPETLWLEKKIIKNKYGANQVFYVVIK